MTDFEYDCLQKKRIAHSASRRKGGSHSKMCYLPSDHLTPKQLKERCGEVVSFNFNKPVKWNTFKSLSKEIQEEYLKNICDMYGANSSNLAQMFGVSPPTVRRYLEKRGISMGFPVGHRMAPSYIKAWERFINGETAGLDPEYNVLKSIEEKPCENPEREDASKEDIANEERAEESSKEVILPAPSKKMAIDSFQMVFSGNIDTGAIANSLRQILGEDSFGKVRVVCELSQEAESCEKD